MLELVFVQTKHQKKRFFVCKSGSERLTCFTIHIERRSQRVEDDFLCWHFSSSSIWMITKHALKIEEKPNILLAITTRSLGVCVSWWPWFRDGGEVFVFHFIFYFIFEKIIITHFTKNERSVADKNSKLYVGGKWDSSKQAREEEEKSHNKLREGKTVKRQWKLLIFFCCCLP